LRPSIAHFIRVAGDIDPEQLEDELLRQPQQLLAALADQLVGQQRGGRGGDRAALALEGDLRHPVVLVEADRHVLLVAAERIGVVELQSGALDPPEVVRPLVVLEDLVAVELVHQRSNTLRASCSPSTRRSISSRVV
jgi:hypothetical protein